MGQNKYRMRVHNHTVMQAHAGVPTRGCFHSSDRGFNKRLWALCDLHICKERVDSCSAQTVSFRNILPTSLKHPCSWHGCQPPPPIWLHGIYWQIHKPRISADLLLIGPYCKTWQYLRPTSTVKSLNAAGSHSLYLIHHDVTRAVISCRYLTGRWRRWRPHHLHAMTILLRQLCGPTPAGWSPRWRGSLFPTALEGGPAGGTWPGAQPRLLLLLELPPPLCYLTLPRGSRCSDQVSRPGLCHGLTTSSPPPEPVCPNKCQLSHSFLCSVQKLCCDRSTSNYWPDICWRDGGGSEPPCQTPPGSRSAAPPARPQSAQHPEERSSGSGSPQIQWAHRSCWCSGWSPAGSPEDTREKRFWVDWVERKRI